MNSKVRAEELLGTLGITIGGSNTWDLHVHDERFYDRVFSGGSLGLGESYVEGWWDVEDMSEFFFRLFRNLPANLFGIGIATQVLKSKLFNLQNKSRAFEVGKKHYDIGNELYENMLGARMAYSCGYWQNTDNLDQAQENKFDLICKKIGLKSGDSVLDIGCGWGGFAQFAAEKYGAKVVGITISKEQAALARERTKGLPIDIRLQDWRSLGGETFTHVVSIGMFEHVGPKNYQAFMQKVRDVLADDGLFLLHTIGQRHTTMNYDPWFNKYIFPNAHLPSMKQITTAIDRAWFGTALFTVEDWHNFGAHYYKTLMAWFERFEKSWPELKGKYDQRFYRMWKYYLLISAGLFKARHTQLWQIVLSKKGILGGYQSVR